MRVVGLQTTRRWQYVVPMTATTRVTADAEVRVKPVTNHGMINSVTGYDASVLSQREGAVQGT